MKGVPFPPESVRIQENQCGTFGVTWRPSSLDSGGGQLTGFQVQIRKESGDWRNCTTFPTNDSCLFKDLQSETVYDVRVQAYNQKGSSHWTSRSKETGEIGKYVTLHHRLHTDKKG